MPDLEPAPTETTPILDTAVLPVPRRRIKFSNVLIGFFAGVALAATIEDEHFGQDMALGYVLLLLAAALFFAIAIHELGHLLAGRIVGFRFSSLQIGPFSLQLEHGKPRVRIDGAPTAGYTRMRVDGARRLRRRLLIFIVAGPFANLLSASVIVLLVKFAFPSVGRSWMSVAAFQFTVVSLALGLLNLLPIGVIRDGARISMLLRSVDSARRWMSIVALDSQRLKGIPAKYWKRTWLRSAICLHDGSTDEFAARWLAYVSANDRKDGPLAASHLERCLELSGLVRSPVRNLTIMEAGVFTAWFRNNALMADKWAALVKRTKQTPRLLQIRMEIALQCSRRDFASALASWHEGLKFIDSLPMTAARDRLREAWLEWQSEIQDRQADSQSAPTLNSAN